MASERVRPLPKGGFVILGPAPLTFEGRSTRTEEERISLVRVLVLLALIPALWFRIIAIAPPAENVIMILFGGYVILLVVGPRQIHLLRKTDLIIVLDLLIVTLIVFISGSVNSPFLYLYYLTILEAAARLDLRQSLASSVAMAAMVILLWMRGGQAEALETTGFRLGVFIASGFFLALLVGILVQEYRAARERLTELQVDNDLASRLSGELRVEAVVEILLDVFLRIVQLSNGLAYSYNEKGIPYFVSARGCLWEKGDPSPAHLSMPALPRRAIGGDIVLHSGHLLNDPQTRVLLCVPLIHAERLQLWLCALSDAPPSMSEAVRRRLHRLAAQGASALEAARLYEKVQELAATDVLTGLTNRRGFLDRMAAELSRSHRTGRPLSVALLDFDELKLINDTYGHSVGDAALARLAQVMTHGMRSSDLAARFGGDEFVLLFPETPFAEAVGILDRLRHTEIAVSDGRGGELRLTYSWGVATWPENGASPEDLLAVADDRLYAMKKSGRDQ